MNSYKLRLALVCILGVLLCAGYVAKATNTNPPANDNCYSAQAVGNGTVLEFDTTYATFDGPGYCMSSPNIWYHHTAVYTGSMTVSLCGSSFDTVLAVYRGSECYPQQIDMIGCNDDACDRQSELTFNVIAGNEYLIEVGGFQSATGEGLMTIGGDEQPSSPANDDCSNALPIGDVTNVAFDTTHATFDGPGYFVHTQNVWFCYTAECTGTATVSLCGSSFDTKLIVYDGCGCNPTVHDVVGFNDDFCDFQSQVTFNTVAGNQYLIEVGGYSTPDVGEGVITVSCTAGEPWPWPPCEPEANDNCVNATAVGNVTNLAFDTTCSTFDGPGHAMTGPNLWYHYTAAWTGEVTVSLCGSNYDTMLAVYHGYGCYPALSDLVAYNDDFCNRQSEVTFAAIAGKRYLIEVGGYGPATGQGLLNITAIEPPPPPIQADLGDAPDSTNNSSTVMYAYPSQGLLEVLVRANYPTVFNDGTGLAPYGPIHLNPLEVAHLGEGVTRESEADTGWDQDGINNIIPPVYLNDQDKEDDGVIFPVNMPHCKWTTFDYLVNVIQPGTDLWVNVWCDWNRDGDWNDDSSTDPALNSSKGVVSEWAVQNQLLFKLSAGIHQITTPAFLPWHPQLGAKDIWMRISLTEQPWRGGSGQAGSGPKEGYEFGETEDYFFAPDTSCSICEDFNGDGVIDIRDLSAFTAQWLDTCN